MFAADPRPFVTTRPTSAPMFQLRFRHSLLPSRAVPIRPTVRRLIRSGFVALAVMGWAVAAAAPAEAAPRRIIIVRHGEKGGPKALCSVGKERAQALAAQYLSPTDPKSLIAKDPPAGFLVMTLHTLETARPVAEAWKVKLIAPPIAYVPIQNNRYFNGKLNAVNREVVHDLMTNPRWHGQTVVMIWEHFHIASEALEQQFAGEQATLYQLLNLAKVKKVSGGLPGGIPKTWPDQTFDYFWILDYDSPEAEVPARFSVVEQEFSAPFANLPKNKWGADEQLPANSGCN